MPAREPDSLRIIDTSAMPTVTATNTNALAIMVAEKGPAIIRDAARQRLEAWRSKGGRRQAVEFARRRLS
ncbi:MAG: hypothetical protein JO081_05225 [Alphaproteobacteria bacterium]|nr:hypothetical protein [Alphaproteobacteria bacterium]